MWGTAFVPSTIKTVTPFTTDAQCTYVVAIFKRDMDVLQSWVINPHTLLEHFLFHVLSSSNLALKKTTGAIAPSQIFLAF
jgi:hypothetical protein